MPAMSPTMTEGGIAEWKIKEGDVFSAGDVLLEVVCTSLFEDDANNEIMVQRKLTRQLSTWKLRMTVSLERSS